jgi:hypothetical protein
LPASVNARLPDDVELGGIALYPIAYALEPPSKIVLVFPNDVTVLFVRFCEFDIVVTDESIAIVTGTDPLKLVPDNPVPIVKVLLVDIDAFIVPVDVIDLTERFPVNTILSAYTLPLMPAPPDNNKAPVTLLVLAVVFVDTN